MTNSVDVDVMVAGAGAAGLATALAAAEGGRSVLIAEARATFEQSCNTVMTAAMIPAGGSRWQAAAGVDDSPQCFLNDVRHKTKDQADVVVAQTLTSVAPELVGWLADYCHVPLELVTDFDYPGHSRHRCHTVPDRSGQTFHRQLLDVARQDARIDLVVPWRVTTLMTDADGAVGGASLVAPDGEVRQLRSRAVVLATNGFAANQALVNCYVPEIAGALYFGGEGSMGDALALGEQVGADIGYLDAYQGHGSVAFPHLVLLTWAVVMHGGVLLNSEGRRFGDESVGYSEFARLVVRQPERQAWVVYDARADAACRSFAHYRRCLEANAVHWANDIGELADLINAPAETLAGTLDRVAAAVRGESADPFGRQHWEAELAPPYAAVRVTGALFHTQGGLHVDQRAAVLRDGHAIPGLYAAGGAAVGMSGHGADGYLAGNGLLAALGLGYVAGHAVRETG